MRVNETFRLPRKTVGAYGTLREYPCSSELTSAERQRTNRPEKSSGVSCWASARVESSCSNVTTLAGSAVCVILSGRSFKDRTFGSRHSERDHDESGTPGCILFGCLYRTGSLDRSAHLHDISPVQKIKNRICFLFNVIESRNNRRQEKQSV